MENSGKLPSKHGTRGRLHSGDSLEYEVVGASVTNQILSDWGGAPDSHSDAILLYRSDVSIAGPLEPTMVVIDGDADVAGRVSVDDPCALFVRGRLRCASFWVHDAEVRIGELEVEVAAFLAQGGGAFHDVGPIRAPVLFVDEPDFGFHADSAIKHLVLLDDDDRALLNDEFVDASLHEVFLAYLSGQKPFKNLPERRIVPRKPSSVPFLTWLLSYEGEESPVSSLSRALRATKKRRDDFPGESCSPEELTKYLVSLKAPDAHFKVGQAAHAWARDEPA